MLPPLLLPTHPPPPAQTAGHGSRHHRTGCCITCSAAEGCSRRRGFFFAFSFFFFFLVRILQRSRGTCSSQEGPRTNLTITISYVLLSPNQYFNMQWQGRRNETTSNFQIQSLVRLQMIIIFIRPNQRVIIIMHNNHHGWWRDSCCDLWVEMASSGRFSFQSISEQTNDFILILVGGGGALKRSN